MKLKLVIRKAIGFFSRLVFPEYSFCGRCGRTWPFCQEHKTPISSSGGCFPLCEDCWDELTPKERLPYYRDMWLDWPRSEDFEWSAIEQAVLGGK